MHCLYTRCLSSTTEMMQVVPPFGESASYIHDPISNLIQRFSLLVQDSISISTKGFGRVRRCDAMHDNETISGKLEGAFDNIFTNRERMKRTRNTLRNCVTLSIVACTKKRKQRGDPLRHVRARVVASRHETYNGRPHHRRGEWMAFGERTLLRVLLHYYIYVLG